MASAMRIIDVHTHLDVPEFAADLSGVFARAMAAGVDMMICVGTDLRSSQQSVEMARRFPGRLYASVGIHPHDVARAGRDDMSAVRELAGLPEVVAIGESGLDFHRDLVSRDLQVSAFHEHIRLSSETGKPLILHGRKSDDELLEILARSASDASPAGARFRGVRHCFDSSPETAARYVEQGFCLSFGGAITRPGFKKAKAAAAAVPADRLLVETDCPYQSPASHVGARNEPAFIVETVNALASLRGETPDSVAALTTANARSLFFPGVGQLPFNVV